MKKLAKAVAIGLGVLIRLAVSILFFWSFVSITFYYFNGIVFPIFWIVVLCMCGASILIPPSKNVILDNTLLAANRGLIVLLRIAILIVFFWSVIEIVTHYSDSLIFQIISIAALCMGGFDILFPFPENFPLSKNTLLKHTLLIAFFSAIIPITTYYSDSIIFQIISTMMICLSAAGIFASQSLIDTYTPFLTRTLSPFSIFTQALLITIMTVFFWVVTAIITHYSDNVIFQIILIMIICLSAVRVFSLEPLIFIQSPFNIFTRALRITIMTAFFWAVVAITTYYFDSTILQIIAFFAISAIGSIAMVGIFFSGLFLISHVLSFIFPSWKKKST